MNPVAKPSNSNPSVSKNAAVKDWSWPFWYLVPIYPYNQKRTIRIEVVKDWIWTFEQVQGIFLCRRSHSHDRHSPRKKLKFNNYGYSLSIYPAASCGWVFHFQSVVIGSDRVFINGYKNL